MCFRLFFFALEILPDLQVHIFAFVLFFFGGAFQAPKKSPARNLIGFDETLGCTSYAPSEFIVDPAGVLMKKNPGSP